MLIYTLVLDGSYKNKSILINNKLAFVGTDPKKLLENLELLVKDDVFGLVQVWENNTFDPVNIDWLTKMKEDSNYEVVDPNNYSIESFLKINSGNNILFHSKNK